MESIMSQKVTAIHNVSDLETFGTFIPRWGSIINFYKHRFTQQTAEEKKKKNSNGKKKNLLSNVT